MSFSTHMTSGMTYPGNPLASRSPDFYPEVAPWMTDSFYSGIDSNHIPALSVAPTDLTNLPYWDHVNPGYDFDSQSASSAASAKSCISPAMVEAEMMHVDMHFQSPMDPFGSYHGAMPPTPPEDFDLELFDISKNDLMDVPSSAETTECEYLGPSPLQFYKSAHYPTVPRSLKLTISQWSNSAHPTETYSVCLGEKPC